MPCNERLAFELPPVYRLSPALEAPALDVMNLLNDVVSQFPHAISFASGRPLEAYFDLDRWLAQVDTFVAYRSRRLGCSEAQVRKQLCQYGPTNGVINEIIASLLENDEKVRVTPAQIMVTNGCQEAMSVCLDGLFHPGDVLVVTTPTYVGITGLCAIRGIPVIGIPLAPTGPDLERLARAVEEVASQGARVRALYVIPDFDNPTGSSCDLAHRQAVLDFCWAHGIYVLEDNPYGMFCYERERLPTMLALDRYGVVVHLGTFSKTICPGFRVGYLVSRARVESQGEMRDLAVVLSSVKSLTTVNTGQYVQAVIGGILLENDCSLVGMLAPAVRQYATQRDAMLCSLEKHFRELGVPDIRWNVPAGGFFVSFASPVRFGVEEMRECASRYDVICMPMGFFSIDPDSHTNEIRLSFSFASVEEIDVGVKSLARFVRDKWLASGSFAPTARTDSAACSG